MATRLLAIADPGCPVSTRYRVSQFEGFLQSNAVELQTLDWPKARPDPAKSLAELLDCVAQADAVVFQRYLPGGASLRRIRSRARRLIYDFDDALLYSESTHGKPRLKPRRAWRFRQMMQCCDAVTAGNEYLAGLARRHAATDRVHIIPTVLDLKRYQCEPSPSNAAAIAGPVIGWIGSRSTLPYLESLRRPLELLSKDAPALTVCVIADKCPDLGKAPVELVPWNIHTEVRDLMRFRVGLAPLPDDRWTRGKCGLRLLQYLAAGVPAVASPVGVQAAAIEAGAALRANSDAEWVDAIRRIMTDAGLAATLAARGSQLVRERFDIQVWAEPLLAIWCGTV